MAAGVLMPKAGITVEECVIGEWLVKKGDKVKKGDILFTYETDKASFECESTADGTILEIFYEEGDEVPCLVNVCAVGEPGESIEGIREGNAGSAAAEDAANAVLNAASDEQTSGTAVSGAVGVVMPKAGITVEECIITEWHKKPGDQISIGDILFTYETDKASFECESTAEGTLLELFFEDGDEVPCLENVCAIGKPGDSTEGLKGSTDPYAAAGKAAPVPAEAIAVIKEEEKQKISPRARKTAAELGIDASAATGSGPYGRIVEADVRAYEADHHAERSAASTNEESSAVLQAAPETEYEDVKFSPVRRATAKAMVRSLTEMAQLTHYHTFDATAIINLRKQIKANGELLGLPNITLNDMVMFAVSRVIQSYPDLNAMIPEEYVLRKYRHVHLGMAVDTPKGLFVPTIFNADQMSLSELCKEAKKAARLVQEGKATPDLLSGATFTVSNPGALGVEMFTPVVNPPQTGILGVCGITTGIKEVNGELKGYPKMGLCLSYDHRALDGTPASRFMKELCSALENFNLLTMK